MLRLQLLLAQARISNLQQEEELQRDKLSALTRRMAETEENLVQKTKSATFSW